MRAAVTLVFSGPVEKLEADEAALFKVTLLDDDGEVELCRPGSDECVVVTFVAVEVETSVVETKLLTAGTDDGN